MGYEQVGQSANQELTTILGHRPSFLPRRASRARAEGENGAEKAWLCSPLKDRELEVAVVLVIFAIPGPLEGGHGWPPLAALFVPYRALCLPEADG
jgi:hypothetical protein